MKKVYAVGSCFSNNENFDDNNEITTLTRYLTICYTPQYKKQIILYKFINFIRR